MNHCQSQTLSLTGLRFDASLGILQSEKTKPQPIQVDAELNLGPQALLPRDDDIQQVLDINLLETMIGKLSHRLLQLPGVLGVRVKIAKLEIFEDCEVAIHMESGQW